MEGMQKRMGCKTLIEAKYRSNLKVVRILARGATKQTAFYAPRLFPTITTVTTLTTIASASATAGITALCLLSCDACVRRKILLSVNLTVADPNLHSENTYLGVSLCKCVVDVCAECVKRCTAFLDHLASCHLGAAYTTADLNLDTLGSNTHC